MWNAKTSAHVQSGKLAVLGVIQEQHAERARLYAQWKQFTWPIVHDPITRLNLAAVPIAVLIDQHGVVRHMNAHPDSLAEFMSTNYEAPKQSATPDTENDSTDIADSHLRQLVARADDILLWKPMVAHRATEQNAIRNYEAALKQFPESAKLKFRLGVAYRMRYDSSHRRTGDFDQAAHYWSAALKQNPNQYIWRRRIQQYGPRQIKPYPFYDWVDQAIADVSKRGETPVALTVPLSGAEIAQPKRQIKTDDGTATNPDPHKQIVAGNKLLQLEATVVPAVVKPGETVRIHLRMTPTMGKWNNEADPLRIWINEDSTGKPTKRLISATNPKTAQSREPRSLEFEFVTENKNSTCTVSGFALYHACLPQSGQCVYQRHDFEINVPIDN